MRVVVAEAFAEGLGFVEAVAQMPEIGFQRGRIVQFHQFLRHRQRVVVGQLGLVLVEVHEGPAGGKGIQPTGGGRSGKGLDAFTLEVLGQPFVQPERDPARRRLGQEGVRQLVAQDGDAGFFSNLLCDLEPGAEIPFHGPHGNFILREITGPVLLLAEETGIAPVRSILQAMPDMEAYLIQSSAASVPALYGEEFTARSALHYVSVTSEGAHERSLAAVDALLAAHPEIREAYIVGLSAFVNAHRAQLKERGWDRKQIVFERYD